MKAHWPAILIGIIIVIVIAVQWIDSRQHKEETALNQVDVVQTDSAWIAPSLYGDDTTTGNAREMIIYGEDIFKHTGSYFGPHGSILQLTNGMNCQNCHLDAGTRPWGNNLGAVFANYPQFRARSQSIQTVAGRVNDCFERSLDGHTIDTNSKEMQAVVAYIKWLGKDVPKGNKPVGTGIGHLPFLNRAADPLKGKVVYASLCQSCHGERGEGQLDPTGKEYSFPPLWGPHSYNDGAGMYRISNLASFVKSNMPFNQATHDHASLSEEQAWDVAAFIDSQPRPHKDQSADWKNRGSKPFDFPFGPYLDHYSQKRHKYGPFDGMVPQKPLQHK